MQIIVKKYGHINSAFGNWDTPTGKLVKSKDHYDRLCKEQGMISYEESQDREKNKKFKDYKLSDKAKSIIQSVAMSKDKDGKVKLGSRAIDAMKEIGAINKKIPSYMKLPKAYQKIGGFA